MGSHCEWTGERGSTPTGNFDRAGNLTSDIVQKMDMFTKDVFLGPFLLTQSFFHRENNRPTYENETCPSTTRGSRDRTNGSLFSTHRR